jgi:2'-5' RNA ligase
MTEARSLRAFLAVPADGLWVESVRGLVARLQDSSPRASWTKPGSWHLTLKFFERISSEKAKEFAQAIAPVAMSVVPGEISAGPASVFPPAGPARVLAVGFAPSPALEEILRLAHEAEAVSRRLGFEAERRAYHPHVTLARLRAPWPAAKVEAFRREVEAWPFPAWLARSSVFYESRLEREGAVHIPIEEWSFSGGPRGVRA